MTRTSTRKFSANEKEIAGLLKQNESWKKAMSRIAVEIHFLDLYLNADIFQKNILNLFEKLQGYLNKLENLRSESLELNTEVRNHHYDIEGMLECEDISCEVFYHEKHLDLEKRYNDFREDFENLRLEIFKHTGNLLKNSNSEN